MATFRENIGKYKFLTAVAVVLFMGFLYIMALVFAPTTFNLPDGNYYNEPAYWVGVSASATFLSAFIIMHYRSMRIEKDENELDRTTLV